MRFYTTPSVQQARRSVFWSLFFIFLLYFTAPALAVLAKYEVRAFALDWHSHQDMPMNLADRNSGSHSYSYAYVL